METVKAVVEFLVDFKREDDWIFDIRTMKIFRTCVSGVLENTQKVYDADGVIIEFGIDEDESYPYFDINGLNNEQWKELELRLPNGYEVL